MISDADHERTFSLIIEMKEPRLGIAWWPKMEAVSPLTSDP